MSILKITHPKIETKGEDGKPNGYLVPIFNVEDNIISKGQHPQQVYLTVVSPKSIKGPHLHKKRWGLFTCIKGNIKIIIRNKTIYEEYYSGENHKFQTIQVPSGIPALLQNTGNEEAFVLNMPSPAWKQDDQDDHPVSFEDYELKW